MLQWIKFLLFSIANYSQAFEKLHVSTRRTFNKVYDFIKNNWAQRFVIFRMQNRQCLWNYWLVFIWLSVMITDIQRSSLRYLCIYTLLESLKIFVLYGASRNENADVSSDNDRANPLSCHRFWKVSLIKHCVSDLEKIMSESGIIWNSMFLLNTFFFSELFSQKSWLLIDRNSLNYVRVHSPRLTLPVIQNLSNEKLRSSIWKILIVTWKTIEKCARTFSAKNT